MVWLNFCSKFLLQFQIIYFRMTEKLTISEVNELSYEDFNTRFGNVVEHCSLCAAAVWRYKPFTSLETLHSSISHFLDQLPLAGKILADFAWGYSLALSWRYLQVNVCSFGNSCSCAKWCGPSDSTEISGPIREGITYPVKKPLEGYVQFDWMVWFY